MQYLNSLLVVIVLSIQNVFPQDERGLPGLVSYRRGNLWGYSDSTKKIKIKPQFDEPADFGNYYGWNPGSPKIAFVKISNKRGIIDETGAFLIKCEFDILDYRSNSNNLSPVIYLQKGNVAYHYTFQGKRLIPVTPELQDSAVELMPIIEEKLDHTKHVSIITTDKRHYNIIIKKYEPFTNQLIKIDSIQLIGSEIKAIPFVDTLFCIRQNKKWGIISADHRMVVKAEFDSIYHIWGGRIFAVQKNKMWSIINPTKLISSPFIYQDIKNNPDAEGFLVKRNNKWGVLLDDFNREILIDKNLYNSYFIMRYSNLICIRNKSGEIIGYVDFYGTRYWE